ncbi:MAG: hypothetical protein JST54_07725 [Deltaproteobacteria bacterium]|nr:hypothetical protein [Deltaproteobacteria bacterium]
MRKPWRLALLLLLAPVSAWANPQQSDTAMGGSSAGTAPSGAEAAATGQTCPPTKPDNLPRFVLSYPSGNPREAGFPPQLQPGDYYNGFQTGTHVVTSPDQIPPGAKAAHCVIPTGRSGPILIP